MDKSEIQQRVTEVVSQVLNIDPEMVTPDSDFVYDLGAESTQSIQLVAAFEEAFDIEMEAEQALAVQTVGAAVDFIAQLL